MEIPRNLIPAPPPVARTLEQIYEDERQAKEDQLTAEVAHLHELCQESNRRYDKLRLAYAQARVRHHDALERQQTKCVKAMLKKFAMWVAIVLVAFGSTVVCLTSYTDVRTANLGEYTTGILYKQSKDINNGDGVALCPTVYVASDVPYDDCEDHPNRIWHLRRNKTYKIDVYVFYSDSNQFGRNISIVMPQVVTPDSLRYSLSIRYALKGEVQTLYWAFLDAADKDVRIDDNSFTCQEMTTIANNTDRVKKYIATKWKAGSYNPDELLPNLYHCRVEFKTTKPRKTYTYTSNSSALGWDFLALFAFYSLTAFLWLPLTLSVIWSIIKRLFKKKNTQEIADAGQNDPEESVQGGTQTEAEDDSQELADDETIPKNGAEANNSAPPRSGS